MTASSNISIFLSSLQNTGKHWKEKNVHIGTDTQKLF